MNYIDLFLSDELLENPNPKLSWREQRRFMRSIGKQLRTEILDTSYEPRLKETFADEERILAMFNRFQQTPIYKSFEWMYGMELVGEENIPNEGPGMIVTNHATPYGGDVAPIFFRVPQKKGRIVYGLSHNLISKSDYMRTVGTATGRKAGVELLEAGKLTLVCPEGIMGAAAPWYDSYTIRPVEGFSPKGLGYIKLAYFTNTPIIPVANIGAEETVVILGDMKPFVRKLVDGLDTLLDFKDSTRGKTVYKLIDGSKVIPIVVTPPLRSKVKAVVDTPINVRDYVRIQLDSREDFAGLSDNDKGLIRGDWEDVNEYVMSRLQNLISEGIEERKLPLGRLIKKLRSEDKSLVSRIFRQFVPI